MLIGKRHRLPNSAIRRTTSMSGITVHASSGSDPPADGLDTPHIVLGDLHATVGPEHESSEVVLNHAVDNNNNNNYLGSFGNRNNIDYLYDNRFLTSMVSPRYSSSRIGGGSAGFVGTAYFLRTCGLCNRRLAPGKDIHMYRGDTAFCSLECREQQIKQDERKEKSSVMAPNRQDRHASPSSSSAAAAATRSSKASTNSETVAAA